LSTLVGTCPSTISTMIKKTMVCPVIKNKKSPYGVGNASQKILKILNNTF